jgi:hypothetical protein
MKRGLLIFVIILGSTSHLLAETGDNFSRRIDIVKQRRPTPKLVVLAIQIFRSAIVEALYKLHVADLGIVRGGNPPLPFCQ